MLILLFTYFFKQNLLRRLTKNHGHNPAILHGAETLEITSCDISLLNTANYGPERAEDRNAATWDLPGLELESTTHWAQACHRHCHE